MVAAKLLLHEEFVCKLPERVDRVEGNIEIVVLTNIVEVLTQVLPDLLPHKADSPHVKVSHLDELLERELSWVFQILKFLRRDLYQGSDEVDNGFWLQLDSFLNNQVDLAHVDVLYDQLRVVVQHLLSFNFSLQSWVVLLFADRAIEKVLVPHGTRSQDIHIVDLTDAVKDVVPGLAQEVSIVGSKL